MSDAGFVMLSEHRKYFEATEDIKQKRNPNSPQATFSRKFIRSTF